MSIISLATDFGLSDPYAGVMKGVILSIAPHARIVDLSHGIGAQDVSSAAFLIDSAFGFFPEKTVHVIVVDPGVGSERAVIAAEAADHFFLAPDNGVLTKILARGSTEALVRVENPEFFRHPVSRTFHGRDIFAPVAARMASGEPLDSFGPRCSPADLVRLRLPVPYVSDTGELSGEVVTIDHFGNLITNLDEKRLARFSPGGSADDLWICIGDNWIKGLSDSYQAVAPGQLLAIIGSSGYLEISVNSGNARSRCGAEKGSPVRVARSG